MENRRILVTDDNFALHGDFKKILCPTTNTAKSQLRLIEKGLVKASDKPETDKATKQPMDAFPMEFDVQFASQGEEALNQVISAFDAGNPFALVFMDVRMPPGWDGITTIKKIWGIAPQTEIVICTAYSDYSHKEILNELGVCDRYLILKKPFDAIEVQQLALGLTNKWNLAKRVRDSFYSQAKLATLGEMTAGIAHEINNPLAIIHANVELLKDFSKDDIDTPTFHEIVEQIDATTMRIAKIIKGLRALSRSEEKEPLQTVELGHLIQETLDICDDKFKKHGIRLTFNSDAAAIKIDCKQIQISQVILNLLNNAFDAVQTYPEKWVNVDVVSQGGYIEIHVTDSGTGIPSSVQDNLFTPFFTTKEIGKGTGLGLSVSSKIVKSHKGFIFIDNQCPNTRFVVRLPLTQQAAEPIKKAG